MLGIGLPSRMGNKSEGWSLLWDWQIMCGPDGLSLWSAKHRDLGICFQELCLQIPVLILLTILSAFYCGKQAQQVMLNERQHWILDFRGLLTFLLILSPIVRICIAIYTYQNLLFIVDYLLPVVEVFTWLVHLGFIHTLKHQPNVSSRGPVFLCVMWTLGYVLCAISLHSRFILRNSYQYPELTPFLTLSYGFNICTFILQSLYTITLLPSYTSDSVSYEIPNYLIQNTERQPLLGSPQVGTYSRFREERDPLALGVAMEDSTFLGRFFFCWVYPLMNKGVQRKLNEADDLYDLPMELTPGYIYNQLEEAMNTNKAKRKPLSGITGTHSYDTFNGEDEISFAGLEGNEIKRPVSLLRALHSCFALHFYGIGILKLIGDCAGFIAPFFLSKLVTFIANKDEPLHNGYLYAAGLFAVTLTAAFCNSHFNFQMSIVGLKIRAALITRIYRKTLTLSSTALGAFSLGEIVNFMSTDTDRVVNSCPSFHSLWSIPFQITVTLYLLYNQVGLAFLAGVGFSIILIPINKLIASKIGSLSTTLMARKDERVKMMAEVIRGIRVLKLQVWEEHFVKKIGKLREMEMKYLRSRKYLDALCVYFWATTPVLISILTFTTYVLLGNQLTAATVFTSIALLNMLIAPLNAFPWVLNGLTEAWVSLKRIQRLLEVPDLDLESYYSLIDNTTPDVDVLIKSATFSWGDRPVQERSNADEGPPPGPPLILNNIQLTVKKGQLIGVMGCVGSGKSSLLAAILAEIDKVEGVVGLSDQDIGYGFVSQQPWLQRGTIRDNILFGKTFDETRYKAVLDACCLEEDLKSLPGGDQAGVGEGGATLSGGQKARVALARAVYQDRNIYLLDDIMSAVDVQVARHIFQRCINTLLRNKTRILCTHHPQYLLLADHIIVLSEGRIAQQGKPAVVLSDYDDYMSPSDTETGEANSSGSKPHNEDTLSLGGDSLLEEESRQVGTVSLDVYASYWKAVGHVLSVLILASMVLMQTSRNMTDWWLSYWVTHIPVPGNTTNLTGSDTGYYLTVYGIMAAANSVFTLVRAFLFAYGGIRAASSVHKSLLKTVIKARCSFFDVTPLGRILNRFSSDTYTIDDSLPFILNILLAQMCSLVGTLVIVIYGLPWLVVVLAPLVPVYHWLQNQYRFTSRELKRLSSVTLSPVYNHFNETLLGLATIRAFRAVPRFKHMNEANLEENLKCQLASQAAAQWLGLRLQFIGVAIVTAVGLISVLQHQFDVADPGWVGLAISYSLSITAMLGGVVNAFTETEKEMIAVERAYEYINQEVSESCQVASAPYAWPSQGVVAFQDVALKYRDSLSPALKGVTFETRPAEKVGVVGRTGAGKSSLMHALFRLTELTDGEVVIDTVNIALIGLKELRSRLAVIPQDPFLFSGTIRENIDPLGQYRDPELWTALQRCHLAATVKKMGGMEAQLSPSGQNLSMGQRQLLCLVRAVLHNAKILCIDEATAHVDQETDRHIQRTLRTSFRQSTVITIAHRVRTIMDSDRVLVMGDGEVLEFESPEILMQDKDSNFYKLARQQF